MDQGPRIPASAPLESQADLPVADWARAEAGQAARLARVAGQLGALDERLHRGPRGWRQRLALTEAAELGWLCGERVTPDRLALWAALRIATARDADDDGRALARVGWAMRRLGAGPGPEAGLVAFLGRHEPETGPDTGETAGFPQPDAEGPIAERAAQWERTMAQGCELHPITRACMGFRLWFLAGLGVRGERIEAAVAAARICAGESRAAVFAPLATGGGQALRGSGDADARLACWLEGLAAGLRTMMRALDEIEAWEDRARVRMAGLSGRTPARLCTVFSEWPLVSAPMAEALASASRATVQRNLGRMEALGLVQEITGQSRFRMWRAAL
ncbi:helix-turn-helix domain-containing protein [Pontibaca methylaminivorans]|uniref:HTH DNA binding domain-containing protein n=1 Tax=Pontibaca methylaminivorans TaxID=515897 RepID=A0A1R3XB94_9RHOB|nr:hypothetical protein [Pontibaca methylaminivorans]SIT86819.1 hypothetical protein SAMN05421849_2435 [Pontibaca methylaminivorans]